MMNPNQLEFTHTHDVGTFQGQPISRTHTHRVIWDGPLIPGAPRPKISDAIIQQTYSPGGLLLSHTHPVEYPEMPTPPSSGPIFDGFLAQSFRGFWQNTFRELEELVPTNIPDEQARENGTLVITDANRPIVDGPFARDLRREFQDWHRGLNVPIEPRLEPAAPVYASFAPGTTLNAAATPAAQVAIQDSPYVQRITIQPPAQPGGAFGQVQTGGARGRVQTGYSQVASRRSPSPVPTKIVYFD